MNTRKLLPATISAILAGGMASAQADVQIFGHLDESVNRIDAEKNDSSLICTTCSIGFKGSEDLGNGLKAIFKLDFQFNINERNNGKINRGSIGTTTTTLTDSGGDTLTGAVTDVTHTNSNSGSDSIIDRDQWLGLAGKFGQVRVGTISTVYKSHGAVLDPIYRTVVQQRDLGIQSGLHSGAGSNGQGRAENTFRYDSPSWNGLKIAGTFTLTPDDTNDNDNPYGVGLSYENGGILLFGDYIDNNRNGDTDAWKVGGKYTLNNFSVFGQFEKDGGLITARRRGTIGGDAKLDGDDADQWMLGGTYSFGNNMIVAAYGSADGLDGNAPAAGQGAFGNDEYKSWEIVGVHKLSKRTSVYSGYGMIDADQDGRDNLQQYTLGMKHKF
jgi:predicted porin